MIELSICLKATIILAAGLVATRLAGRASAAVRAAILTSTFAALLLLPILTLLLADQSIEIPVRYDSTRQRAAGRRRAGVRRRLYTTGRSRRPEPRLRVHAGNRPAAPA